MVAPLLLPGARITAFEPEPTVFGILKDNVASYELSNVELVNRAVWKEDGVLQFSPDAGSTAGRVSADGSARVTATSLRPYLSERVDFLKIDIEGAEYEVLQSCQDLLHNVERLFVEYHSFVGREQNLAQLINKIVIALTLWFGARAVIEGPHRNSCL